jgi:hypothetical protein
MLKQRMIALVGALAACARRRAPQPTIPGL